VKKKKRRVLLDERKVQTTTGKRSIKQSEEETERGKRRTSGSLTKKGGILHSQTKPLKRIKAYQRIFWLYRDANSTQDSLKNREGPHIRADVER